MVDSGTSYILLPADKRDQLLDTVSSQNEGMNCTKGQVAKCTCKGINQFPEIYFNIGGIPYFIPHSDYILHNPIKGECYVLIIGVPKLNFYIFGLNFFKNYYTVFDQEEMRVGITQSINANNKIKDLVK